MGGTPLVLMLLLALPFAAESHLYCDERLGNSSQWTDITCPLAGHVFSSFQFVNFAVGLSFSYNFAQDATSCASYTFNSQPSCQTQGNIRAAFEQNCINRQSCNVPVRGLHFSCGSAPAFSYQLGLAAVCDTVGGQYYIPPFVGCPRAQMTNVSCCTAPTTCSGATPLLERTSCVSACSAGFSASSTSAGSVCLDANCTAVSTRNCSQCIRCVGDLQVSSRGLCELPPLINVTAPEVPALWTHCGGPTLNVSSDNGVSTKLVNWAVSGITRSAGATIASANCNLGLAAGSSTTELATGITYFNCTVVDSRSLSSSCLLSIRVFDPHPPVLYCENKTVSTDAGSTTYLLDAQNPLRTIVYSDNSVLGNATASCNFSGSLLVPVRSSVALQCSASDSSNTVSCLSIITVADLEPPILSHPQAQNAPFISDNDIIPVPELSNSSFAIFNWNIPDVNDNVDGSSLPVACNFTGNVFPLGVTLVSCNATDLSNNTGYFRFSVEVLDTTPPRLTCPTSTSVFIFSTPYNLSWTLPQYADNVGVVSTTLLIDGINRCPTSQLCTLSSFSTSSTTTTFLFTAFDAAGLFTPCTWQITVLSPVDTVPPVFLNASCAPNATMDVVTRIANPGSSQAQVLLDYYARDPDDRTLPINIRYEFRSSAAPNVVSTDRANLFFQVGRFNVTITAKDNNGNSATCLVAVVILDMEPPVISGCNFNNSLATNTSTSSSSSFASITTSLVCQTSSCIPSLTATDNHQMNLTRLSCTLPNGTMVFPCSFPFRAPLGVSSLLLEAFDRSGNRADCSFQVGVYDAEPPVIIGCQNIVADIAFGQPIGFLPCPVLTATDNSRLPVTLSYGIGLQQSPVLCNTNVSLGVTQVLAVATDSAGNQATCPFTMRVRDNVAPVIVSCPAPLIVPNSAGLNGTTVNWTSVQATDNSGQFNISFTPNVTSGQFFAIGNHPITITVIDLSGNLATCFFSINVYDLSKETSTSSSNVGPIAGAGAAGGVIILLVLVLVILRRIQKKKLEDAQQGYAELMALSDEYILEKARVIQLTLMAQKQAVAPSLEAQMTKPEREFELPPPSLPALEAYLRDTMKKNMDRACIVTNMEIGQGEFGSVFDGIFRNPTTGKETKVAIKQLKLATSEDSKMRFLKEAAINAQFNHPNIVRLIGVCLDPPNTPNLIVLEFMHLGSLKSYLESELIKDKLEPLTLLRMAIDAAAGMVYLSEAGFVHRDIAARNVLIDKEMTCRIGDFGLSVDLASCGEDDGGIYSGSEGARIPIRWSAPEAVLYRHFSTSSDVWSFGILMWEIWSYGATPYGDWTNKKVIQMTQSGYRLPNVDICPSEVYRVMIECWNKNPKLRPPFTRISAGLIETWKDINRTNDVYGASRRNSLAEADLQGSGLYDNAGQCGEPFEEEDDHTGMLGYEHALAETNMSSKPKAAKKGKQATAISVYDVGQDGQDSDTEAAEQQQAGRAPPSATNASLYDVGGEETALVHPSQVVERRPSAQALEEVLAVGRTNRESLGFGNVLTSQNLGQRVTAKGYGEGTLVFVGPSFHDGEVHCGVELDSPLGASDGIFQGKRYFTCPVNHGILVPAWSVSLVAARMLRRGSTQSESEADNDLMPRRPSYFAVDVPGAPPSENSNTAVNHPESSQAMHSSLSEIREAESEAPSAGGYLEMGSDDENAPK